MCDRNGAVGRMIIDFLSSYCKFSYMDKVVPLWMIVWHNDYFKLYQCVLHTSDVMDDILRGE